MQLPIEFEELEKDLDKIIAMAAMNHEDPVKNFEQLQEKREILQVFYLGGFAFAVQYLAERGVLRKGTQDPQDPQDPDYFQGRLN